jgi:hypothetical protein
MERVEQLRLCHAPRGAFGRFDAFISGLSDPNVSLRDEVVIDSAIEEQNLFFVLNEVNELVGTTGFYHHGTDPDLVAEIGSTLIDKPYRGVRLQVIMYKHIVALEWLQYRPLQPVFALVDHCAVGSYTNIEHCGFRRLDRVPVDLLNAKKNYDWKKIETGEKRLYRLTREAVADSLEFVANNGSHCPLLDKQGRTRYVLSVEFKYLQQEGVSEALRLEAEVVRNSTYGI